MRAPSQDQKKKTQLLSEYKTQKMLCIVFEVLSSSQNLGCRVYFVAIFTEILFELDFL